MVWQVIKGAPVIEVLKTPWGDWGIVRINGFVIPEITTVDVHFGIDGVPQITVRFNAVDIKFVDEQLSRD